MKRFYAGLCCALVVIMGTTGWARARIIDRVVAQVNERVITLSALKREAKVLKLEHPERFRIINLDDPRTLRFVLDQMISTILIEEELKKMGREVTDKEVNAAIESVKKRNKMSYKQFEAFLKQKGLSIEAYREALKQRIERMRFFNITIKSHIMISDDEVKAYYEKHKDEFGKEERVRIAQIFVPISKDLTPSQRLERQNIIMRIEGELFKGKDFQSLLKKYQSNALIRVSEDLGWFKRKDLMKPIADVAFKLKKGAVSDVIETKSGFHIIKVLDIKKSQGKRFEDVKAEIQRLLFKRESEKRLDQWLKNAKKQANIQIML